MKNNITIYLTYKYGEKPSFLCRDDLNFLKENILTEVNKHKNNSQSHEIIVLARGSTSICFETEIEGRIKIIKVFSPSFLKESEQDDILGSGFCWIKNDINYNVKFRFYNRFERFVNQLDTINTIIKNSKKEKQNSLLYAQLALTDLGIAIIFDRYFGNSLEYELNHSDNILDRIELIEKAAQSINEYSHKQCLFHGDIKPENFFKIEFENSVYVIRNIDFDTCVETKDIKNDFLNNSPISTTPLYYDKTYIQHIVNKNNVKEWIALDVTAVVKMLIYAILPNMERDRFFENLSSPTTQDWYTFFESSFNYPISNENDDKLSFLLLKSELLNLIDKYFFPSKSFWKKDWYNYMDDLLKDIKSLKNTIQCYFSTTTDIEPTTSTLRLYGIKLLENKISIQEKKQINNIISSSDLENFLFKK